MRIKRKRVESAVINRKEAQEQPDRGRFYKSANNTHIEILSAFTGALPLERMVIIRKREFPRAATIVQ